MTTTQTQPQAKAQTKEEVHIEPSIYSVVEAFVKADTAFHEAESKRESKYWPMVEEAIKQIQKGKDPNDIRDQFYASLRKANGYHPKGKKAKETPPSKEHTNWLLMSGRVLKIAKKGTAWIEQRAAEGTTGFWPLANMITAEESAASKAADEKAAASAKEATEKGKEEATAARAFKQSPAPEPVKKPKTSKYKKAAEKLGIPTVTVSEGKVVEEKEKSLDASYSDAYDFFYEHPDQIFRVVQDLLKDEVLSNDGWQKIEDEISLALKALKARK